MILEHDKTDIKKGTSLKNISKFLKERFSKFLANYFFPEWFKKI